MQPQPELLAALRQYWGYEGFRPVQENIVRSVMQGRDVAVIMPTGGGKSLCYQLPAIVMGGTAIVISPLIALMQDQVAHLTDMGIAAAVLNSSIEPAQQRAIMQNAARGAYRLLYLSPERLARPDTITWLQNVPVTFFAIDEAHCISEWGHEFRPEYRQLSSLRKNFPGKPIIALTASATQRVRHDILRQLQLAEPAKFIVSFYRPNLRYLIRETTTASQSSLLMAALRAHQGSNVIIYAPTIKTVQETVDMLRQHKIESVPYHGQMDTAKRQSNQEMWMSDEVPVLVGTLAFGLGINKPSVRTVIHLSLPKSVEQYYQEAGRAGRDGQEADCLLLWRKQDTALLAHFINELQDKQEQSRAWDRYHAIRRFADQANCRHREICLHFGENPKWAQCHMCDVCGNMPDWLAEEEAELADEQAPKARRGRASRPVTPPTRTPRPVSPSKTVASTGDVDPDLMEYLREWRRGVSKEHGLSSFLILTDAALQDLCRRLPKSRSELLLVTGIGERKAEQYGDQILYALRQFAEGTRAKPAARRSSAETPADETLRLLQEGKSFEEIADIRQRHYGTIVSMVADLVERGRLTFDDAWLPADHLSRIAQVVRSLGTEWLKPIKEALPDDSYEDIRLVVAKLRREDEVKQQRSQAS